MIFKRLDRYLIGEFFVYLIFGLTLVVIFLMVNTILFQMLNFIIEKHVPMSVFSKILFYQIPAYVVMALPMATLFASLISVSRMSKDSEIDVMRTSGIGVWRIMMPMLFAGMIVSACGWVMFQKLVPWTNNQSAKLWRQFLLSDVMSRPMTNIFFKGKGDKMFFIKSYDPSMKTASGIMIYESGTGTYPRLTVSPLGVWEGKNLVITNGLMYNLDKDGLLDYEMKFEKLTLNVERHMEEIYGEQKTPQEMTLEELRDKIALFKESGIDTRQFETDMHFKMSIPLACFILVLMGVPLSIRTGRSGMMAGIVAAVILVILYWILTIITTALGYKGVLPPVVAAWSQNAVFLLIGIILIIRTRK